MFIKLFVELYLCVGATYYFYTGPRKDGGLQFGDVTYSMLSVVGDIAMLGASYIYGACASRSPRLTS